MGLPLKSDSHRYSPVGDCKPRADCQGSELIDRVAAGAPVGKLLFVEALGHTRVPFAGHRPDRCSGIELATIDAHRAAEAAADIERRLDDGIAGETRRDRLEIGDFPGRMRGAIPFLLVGSGGGKMLNGIWDGTVLPTCVLPRRTGCAPA
jgi:hypothetical protein